MRTGAIVIGLLALASARVEAQPLPARWPRTPLIEIAREEVGANEAWDRFGVLGRGSILCLVDTGVDATHRDLTDASGAPRVRWLLDSFAAPRGRFASLEERFGGAVWRGDEVGLPGDPSGHGTAMAAVALGDGSDDAGVGASAGLAPEASLIVVRAYDPAQGGFPDDAIVNGVRFCRALSEDDASIDPARMVVLLSLGGHDGAHDGDGAFERALAEEARAVPIVVAAGNDGERAVHATARLFAGETSSIELHVPRSDRADAELALTVRRRGGTIAIEAPRGASQVTLTDASSAPVGLDGAEVRVEAVDGEPELTRVRLAARGGQLASGTYRLVLGGPIELEVWLAGSRLGPTFFAPSLGGVHVRTDEAITIPATADALIAVGASVSRHRVMAEAGELVPEGDEGARAPFSSIGPSPSGAPKPDLLAPGGWISTALSRDVRDGDPENLVGGTLARYRSADGRIAVRGTSVAAAVVAGALLLALELDPSRGPDARALLVASARDAAWSSARGAGVLDVPRLLAMARGDRDAQLTEGVLVATRAVVPTDDRIWLLARTRGVGGLPAGGALHVVVGDRTFRAPLSFGTASLAIPRPSVEVGRPLVVWSDVDGSPLAPIAIPVELERGPHGAVTAVGGGCTIASTPPRSPLFAFLMVLAVLVGTRRPRNNHD